MQAVSMADLAAVGMMVVITMVMMVKMVMMVVVVINLNGQVKIRILRRISRWRSTGRCLQWHDQRQILMFLSSQGKESPKN